MSYGKVKDTFWTDKKVRGLSDDAKMLALYLMTGPHRNMLGCMRIPDGYLLADLEWSSKRLSDAIAMLSECDFIVRDEDGWTLILNQLKHDPLKVPNHARAAVALMEEVPTDSVVYQHLAPKLKAALDAIDMASLWHPNEIAIPIPSPLPKPLPKPETKVSRSADASLKADFKIWYQAFPIHEAPDDAERAYIKARKQADAETLLAAAKTYAAKPDRDPKFTKHPATWLNKGCWKDHPVTQAPQPASDPDAVLRDKANLVAMGIPSQRTIITQQDYAEMLKRGMVTVQQAEKYGYKNTAEPQATRSVTLPRVGSQFNDGPSTASSNARVA